MVALGATTSTQCIVTLNARRLNKERSETMASMDYCVFENTAKDLRRCIKKLKSRDEVSDYEEAYKGRLYDLCKEYADLYERV